jgi:hypothetical protein
VENQAKYGIYVGPTKNYPSAKIIRLLDKEYCQSIPGCRIDLHSISASEKIEIYRVGTASSVFPSG